MDVLKVVGYINIEYYKKVLDGEEFIEVIKDVYFVGICLCIYLIKEILEYV